ncbi:hypothetical protein D3C71_1023100 [compost metagenome]
MTCCRRAFSPSRAWCASSSGSERPAPVSKRGRMGARVGTRKAQRRAMSMVLSQASGRSENSWRMASAVLNQCSPVMRRRSSWPVKAPSEMHSRASCDFACAALA